MSTDPTDYEVEVIQTNEQGPPGPRGPNPNTVWSGHGPPTLSIGIIGDFYINVDTWFIYGPLSISGWPTGQSIVGPRGFTGQQGPAGNTIWSGSGAPGVGVLAVNGDFYIDTTNWLIYGPYASGWPAGVNLVGPAGGQTLRNGTGAPSNSLGGNGDFYIRTDTWFIYGPKAAGVWPAGVSITGPQGPQGIQGNTGAGGTWASLTGKPTTVSGFGITDDIVMGNVTQAITKGYTLTPNNVGNLPASYTPDPTLGNYQFGTNNGAFTLNSPSADCAMTLLVTNSSTAGTISFSGYTVSAGNTGDNLDAVNGHKFILSILRINSVSSYMVKALQ